MLYKNKQITEEVLKTIKLGDKISCHNEWDTPMTVVGLNDKFILLHDCNTKEYSIIEKQSVSFNYNAYKIGDFRFGVCNLIFGLSHDLTTNEGVENTLNDLNSGAIEVSQRNALPLKYLSIC